jgi:hypothetical protein
MIVHCIHIMHSDRRSIYDDSHASQPSSSKIDIRVWSPDRAGHEIVHKLTIAGIPEVWKQLICINVSQIPGVLRRVVASHIFGDGVLRCC